MTLLMGYACPLGMYRSALYTGAANRPLPGTIHSVPPTEGIKLSSQGSHFSFSFSRWYGKPCHIPAVNKTLPAAPAGHWRPLVDFSVVPDVQPPTIHKCEKGGVAALTMMSYRRTLPYARGPKKHLKRVAAPKHWMLDKLTGVFAPRPSTGPHKLRECLPLIIFLRNRLKYALTGDEVKKICMQRFIKIDGKVRTDITYPAGFMDVISIEKTGEHFRLIYDVKGRFTVHRITAEEAKYKLCKVRKIFVGTKGIPHLVTHDARTIRYPDPLIKTNDTVQIDLETGKITEFIKFDTGNVCMVTGGANLGRVGVIINRERHPGSFDVVHVKDSTGNTFATRLSNIFVIGKGNKPWVSLPRGKGIRLTIAEERDKRLAAKQSS
ncbi:RS4 protein, partial [Polyodon spathula]|nr:RS4 protein [Polyodon spathula]